MALAPNIAITTIGYNHYAIESTQDALELMKIMSKAVQVDDSLYGIREYTDVEFCLSNDQTLPHLKFIGLRKLDGMRTRDEIKEQGEREKKDREDMEQSMKDVTMIELPAPTEVL
jgi:hypothetical protein